VLTIISRRATFAVLGALAAAVMAVPALGSHSTPGPLPNSWNQLAWVGLVPAHNQCTAPVTTHPSPFALPGCNPAPTSCLRFGPSGRARMRMRRIAPSGVVDIQIQARLDDVKDPSGCFGPIGPFTGNLTARFVMRLSDANCSGSTHCTPEDFTVTFLIPCAGGNCPVITKTLNTLYGPLTVVPSTLAVFEMDQLSVQDPGSNDFVRPGIFVP